MRLSPTALALLALAATACTAPPVAPANAPEAAEARMKRAAVGLKGTVVAPAGLVGMDGGSLVAAGAGNLVAAGAGNLVGLDGGSLVARTGALAPMRRLLAVSEAPLANAAVYLAHADGTPVKPAIEGRTDANGRFTLANVPAGHYMVVAAAAADGRAAALEALVTLSKEESALAVGTASTMVTAAATAGHTGPITGFNAGAYGRAVGRVTMAFGTAEAPDLTNASAIRAATDALAAADPELAAALAQIGLASSAKKPTAAPVAAPAPTARPASTAQPAPGPPATPTPTPAGPDYVAGTNAATVSGTAPGFTGGDAREARYNQPMGIAAAAAAGGGTALFVADLANHAIRALTPASATWQVTTLAGGPTFAGFTVAPGPKARFQAPTGVAEAPGGGVYVADADNHVIRLVSAEGATTDVWAGSPAGEAGKAEGARLDARFDHPIALARAGNVVVVADNGQHAILRIENEQVTRLAGAGAGFADGPAAAAKFNDPRGVAIAADGTVYVADAANNRIRMIKGGQVTTFAGDGQPGFGDGPAAQARFNRPSGLALDREGRLLVADTGNHRIRLVAGGKVQTLAGSGTKGNQDGNGPDAMFADPAGLAVDPGRNRVYVADAGNARLRRVDWP